MSENRIKRLALARTRRSAYFDLEDPLDRARSRRRFLILGSASPELLRQGSESLAGRIASLDGKPARAMK